MQRPPDHTNRTPIHALITGGAGFIGSHLAEALLARGDRVTIVDNLSTGQTDNVAHLIPNPGFRVVVDSIANDAVVDELVGTCDVVFHLAAAVGVELILKDPARVFETNILGTHALLKAASRHQTKVLLASTSEIYGKSERLPFKEDDDRVLGPTTNARWSYSASKAVDEFLALAYFRQENLPIVIFRLFNTVGPRQTGRYGMVVPRFVQQALGGEPLLVYGDGRQSRCFCDVSDAVRAVLGLADCAEAVGKVFNVGSTAEVTIRELAERVLALTDESVPSRANGSRPVRAVDDCITVVPYDRAYEPGFEDMRRRVPDVSRIKATIGWEARLSLDETLRRVIAYYRDRALGTASPVAVQTST
ncbi:MAG TPA: GDP-mannose 4,6-dehydratase [Chloroflexota bacterium]|nr:GDP-mannose 4,6-dehydratase [Chloroflexota bacterium]